MIHEKIEFLDKYYSYLRNFVKQNARLPEIFTHFDANWSCIGGKYSTKCIQITVQIIICQSNGLKITKHRCEETISYSQ